MANTGHAESKIRDAYVRGIMCWARNTLAVMIQECDAHNAEYQHITPPGILVRARAVINEIETALGIEEIDP